METYEYRLIGIKADEIMTIPASCQTEAEIIIESFHDGGYELLSEPDEPDYEPTDDYLDRMESLLEYKLHAGLL